MSQPYLSKSSGVGFMSYVFHRPYKDVNLLRRNLMETVFDKSKELTCMDLKAHYGCVNGIEFSQNGEWMTSGGDDKRVLVWNVEKTLSQYEDPVCMNGEHHSNIFCLAYGSNAKRIYSGGNDEQVIIHDAETGETVDVFLHEEAVYCISVHPEMDEVFATACDDGRILIYDTRQQWNEDPFCLANYTSPMHSVMYNPVEPRLLVTANSKEGIALWDIRKPRSCLMRYGGGLSQQSGMSVRFNHRGDQILALRRRLPPVLYHVHSAIPACQFDHSGYYNSCTMKSCCFAGENDEYVLSGSDDFNVYMWKIPNKNLDSNWVSDAHCVLQGHRSIVNQTRYNPANGLIASSGVEKVIKIWSPFSIGVTKNESYRERAIYSHEEYLSLMLRGGQGLMTHDYSHENKEEDSRMIAFFDSLVQRELEGWSSSSGNISDVEADETTDSARLQLYEAVMRTEALDSDSDTSFTEEVADENTTDSANEVESESHAVLLPLDSVALGARQILEAIDGVRRELNSMSDREENNTETNQRHVSELIAEKRKDYLTKLPLPDLSNCTDTKVNNDTSVSSSSVGSTSSLSSSDFEDDVRQMRLAKSTAKLKQNANIRKLQYLRNRVEHSDSESDSCEDVSFNSKSVGKNGMSNTIPVSDTGTSVKVTIKNHSDNTKGKLCMDYNNGRLQGEELDTGHEDSEPSCSTSQANGSNASSGEPLWTEFKRFKNRVERARRQYRKHSNDENSSGEERSLKKKKK